MKRRLVCITASVLAAACADSPTEPLPELGISWLEWPAAVTPFQQAEVHITANSDCFYHPVFRAELRDNEVRITAQTVRDDQGCLERSSGSGAGYDTVVTLPRLSGVSGERLIAIRAPMSANFFFRSGRVDPVVRAVGNILVGIAPDTTTKVAGFIQMFADSAAACWLARPFSRQPQPELAFARSVPLQPVGYRLGYVTGSLVRASPAICGQPLAIDPTELTVDATP